MILRGIKLKDLDNIAESFADSFLLDNNNLSKVIHLSGDLGSGKTTFVKHLGKQLGIAHNIQSPTFTLMREYDINRELSKARFDKLIHIDAYRFENKDEGEVLNLNDYIKGNNLIIIEWAEKMHDMQTDIKLNIKRNEDETRDFIIN